MTEEFIMKEIDCSATYAEGQAFQIIPVPVNLYGIKLKKNGEVPSALNGRYTSVLKATEAISTFLAFRKEHFDHVARKKAVKRKTKTTTVEK